MQVGNNSFLHLHFVNQSSSATHSKEVLDLNRRGPNSKCIERYGFFYVLLLFQMAGVTGSRSAKI
jgi:hypothetical protein